MPQVTEAIREELREEAREYRHGEHRPLAAYTGAMATYGLVAGGLTVAGWLGGGRLPARVEPWDVTVMAIATHKLARMISKDAITSPIRMPFTRFRGPGGPAEVQEEVREHDGPKHMLGELLSCPFCLAPWLATAYASGLVFAPRFTRLAGATLAAVAGSDWLQLGYARLQRTAEAE